MGKLRRKLDRIALALSICGVLVGLVLWGLARAGILAELEWPLLAGAVLLLELPSLVVGVLRRHSRVGRATMAISSTICLCVLVLSSLWCPISKEMDLSPDEAMAIEHVEEM
jgi:hypothetical protein